MKIKELLELNDDEEPGRDYPNPIPAIDGNSPDFNKFFNAAEEADNLIVYAYKKQNNIEGNLSGSEYGNILKQSRQAFGNVVNIPIDRLIATETKLNKSHLDKIVQGEPSEKLPDVYKINSKYYLSDGNHRAAAAALQGKQSIKVLLLDIAKLKNDLTPGNK